jgi:hypothetical protein
MIANETARPAYGIVITVTERFLGCSADCPVISITGLDTSRSLAELDAGQQMSERVRARLANARND